MTTRRAYARNADGTLELTTVLVDADGVYTMGGYPLDSDHDEVALHGWQDSRVDSYNGGALLVAQA